MPLSCGTGVKILLAPGQAGGGLVAETANRNRFNYLTPTGRFALSKLGLSVRGKTFPSSCREFTMGNLVRASMDSES